MFNEIQYLITASFVYRFLLLSYSQLLLSVNIDTPGCCEVAYLSDPDSYAGWSFYTSGRATQARQVEG